MAHPEAPGSMAKLVTAHMDAVSGEELVHFLNRAMIIVGPLCVDLEQLPEGSFKKLALKQTRMLLDHNRKKTVQSYFMMPLQAM